MAAIHHPGLQIPTLSWPAPRPPHGAGVASVYRRRRIVVAALLLGALLLVGWVLGVLGGGPLAASEAGSRSATVLPMEPVASATHVVAPGDTLWSIARRLVPEGDVRPVVDSLAAHRNGRPLQVGERIAIP